MNDEEKLLEVYEMIESPDEEKIKQLIFILKNYDSVLIRETIVTFLKHYEIDRFYEDIFDLFSSEDAYLRNAAVEIFGSKDIEAVAFLTSKMDSQYHEVRKLILDSLALIGLPEAKIAVRSYSYDENLNVQITAIEYIGKLGDGESVPEIVKIFKEKDEPMLRSTIIQAITELKSQEGCGEILVYFKDKKIPQYLLPDFLKMVGTVADLETILKTLEFVEYNSVIAKDLVEFINEASYRYQEVVKERNMLELIKKIVDDPNVDTELKELVRGEES